MTVQCVIIDKQNNKKQVKINVNSDQFYKKCKLRSAKDFDYRHSWKIKEEGEVMYLSIFAKNNGRANTENKCELPPPLDNQLYFGSLLVVKHKEEGKYDMDDLIELTVENWEKHYNKLYGGFEDLGEEDSYSSEESIDPELLTKEGYSKEDGFVVESDEEIIDDEGDEDDEEEEEEEEYIGGEETGEDESDDASEDESDSEYDTDNSYIASELEEEEYVDTDED
tara:strand:- start:11538 stop:12209 length:672 start_codon:yes stop_codon:yes gene_type:complete